jgi:hypothetical protein
VYFYETVAETFLKNINQGIFENILKNTDKKSISHIDVYGANGPKDLFLNLLKYSQTFPNLYFMRYLSYSLLKMHRNLTSGYLRSDKASLKGSGWSRR